MLIDQNYNVIQFRGDINPFVDHSQGEASLNLLKIVPYGLAQELKKAVEEAWQRNVAIERIGLRYRDRNGLRGINVSG